MSPRTSGAIDALRSSAHALREGEFWWGQIHSGGPEPPPHISPVHAVFSVDALKRMDS